MSKKMSSEDELLKIGARMKALRKLKGYSNPDKFAYDHDLNRSQYGKYETGRVNLNITTLIQISNCLGVTLEEFFGKGYHQAKPKK